MKLEETIGQLAASDISLPIAKQMEKQQVTGPRSEKG